MKKKIDPYKPFYLHFSHSAIFKKNDIIKADLNGDELIVLNPCCKNQWWRKILLYFRFKVSNIEGLTKVKLHRCHVSQALRIVHINAINISG